jgi:ubiquinone/menaquinone biosynthesis C-methylase UbiE
LPEAPPDQQGYWNSNLDPQNLGKSSTPSAEDWRVEQHFHHTPDQLFALQQHQPLPGKRILEIGAGLGMNSMHMAAEGATVVAIDIAPDRLRQLRLNFTAFRQQAPGSGKLHLVKAAAEALPFRDLAFDGAYTKSVLIHTKLEQAAPEIARVLKQDGVGTFIEPMTANPFVNLYRRTLAPKIWQSIARYFAEPEFAIFRQSFSRVTIQKFYFLSFLAFAWQFGVRIPALFWLTLKPMNALDRLLMRIPSLADKAWFAVLVVRK